MTAETPEGGDHFEYEGVLDGVGGFPGIYMCIHEELEMGKLFAMEDEFLDVGTVGDGIKGRAAFAFGSLGAGGFQRVEARGFFAFIVWSHVVSKIADELKGAMVKCFRILVEWLVISSCRLAAQPGYEKGLELEGFRHENLLKNT